jgi:hypothetical protein
MAGPKLTINSLLLEVPGFCGGRDLTDLETGGPMRGEDFVSHGVAGQTFRPKVQDAHVALVSLLIFGRNNAAGVAHPDNWTGIKANVQAIRAACVTASLTSLVTATVTYPNASTRSGQVYCPRLDVAMHNDDRTGAAVSAVLEVVIPSGALT